MNLSQIQNVYFIGIGGIGMSALARYFKFIGKKVAGYDKTPTTLTDELSTQGILLHFEDRIESIPAEFSAETTLVVITPAIPADHTEWNWFAARGYAIKKRAEVLGIITKDTFCFAVAGTHGKTTTSSILGHILYHSGADVTAFVGGIVENYQSNLIGSGKTVTVVEADEYDRSFLHLHPDLACVTSMDADHLDIYGTADSIQESFREFASKIDDAANLFISKGVMLNGQTIGVDQQADYCAFNVSIQNGAYVFDVKTPGETIIGLRFGLPGKHNLANAVTALAMAKKFGTPTNAIAEALSSFKGIRRRFSYQLSRPNLVFIDDYAHHPTEIDAVYQAVEELYPGKRKLAVFQPHLFSRTRDFIDGFAKSLSAFDQILLLDIYPARELPIAGVTSSWLLDKIENVNKKLVSKQELLQAIKAARPEVLLTLGAGDLGEMIEDLKQGLS
jgi:UDP-N-acetylmuramate--alanine ligase